MAPSRHTPGGLPWQHDRKRGVAMIALFSSDHVTTSVAKFFCLRQSLSYSSFIFHLVLCRGAIAPIFNVLQITTPELTTSTNVLKYAHNRLVCIALLATYGRPPDGVA
uniref:Uncharacterized protein n=1 Tax=Neogobius melanostomus TaxID=47308 RepID=A0A8C6UFS9_9GOBI